MKFRLKESRKLIRLTKSYILILLVMILGVALSSCAYYEKQKLLSELEQNKEIWTKQNIKNYRFTIVIVTAPMVNLIEIEVKDGKVFSAKNVKRDIIYVDNFVVKNKLNILSSKDFLSEYGTIDKVFESVKSQYIEKKDEESEDELINDRGEKVEPPETETFIEYDEKYGLPKNVATRCVGAVLDCVSGFNIKDFEKL